MLQGTSTTESYSYDAVGNRLSSLGVSPYAYNTSNELTSKPSVTFTYDRDGNTLTKVDSTGTTTYNWDFENRLSSVVLPGSGGTVSFKYDPYGRRVQKTSSAATTNYVYDGANTLEEVDGSGSVVARYVQNLGIDEPLAETRGSTTSYYEADGLGSVSSLTNSSGALANTYTYDSFGNQTGSSGTVTNNYRYTGRELDLETGVYYQRARYYDPRVGRFVGEDPLQFGGDGPNFYDYVSNSPTGFTDIFGLSTDAPKAGLCDIAKKSLEGPCRKFLDKLANMAGTTAGSLIGQLQATAVDAQSYIYDGPSSNVPLDESKFPGASSDGSTTVGQWFGAHTGSIALSQKNGSAIFLTIEDWQAGSSSLMSPYTTWGGTVTPYGLGVLTHELLHKNTVGGGFSHAQMEEALNAIGAPRRTLGREDIADRIGKICFGGK